MLEISVVIPVYRCQNCLESLHRRLTVTLSEMTSAYEIIFVEDASPDGSWDVMRQVAAADSHVTALKLSRNFGQHAAITAGLAESHGHYAVVMDCDLQDPPEIIPRFYAKAKEGFEIIFAKRKKKQHSFFRRMFSKTYFWLLNQFSPIAIDPEFGGFSMVSRSVINAYLKIHNHSQHYLFMLHWLGFRSTHIEYQHAERGDENDSSYSLSHLIKFALEGLFLQTTQLLRWIVYFGFAFALLGFAIAFLIIYLYFTRSILPGWTSLSVLILVVGGVMIISMGIMALYIGKIFEQVQGRPHYVIAHRFAQDEKLIHVE